MSRRVVYYLRTGLIAYSEGLELQKQFAKQLTDESKNRFKNALILMEHRPVYTVGIRDKEYTCKDESTLRNLGADFYRTNRGGLITFHGPGQLVAYPILNLKLFKPSIRWYVCHLEKAIVDLCAELDISATNTTDTGVWVKNKKICAMGIHASRYITTHGLALNCDIDLKWFEYIVPCGLKNKGVTSLSNELKRPFNVTQTVPIFLNSFQKIFDCELVEISSNEI